jgi:hypothetical protein
MDEEFLKVAKVAAIPKLNRSCSRVLPISPFVTL